MKYIRIYLATITVLIFLVGCNHKSVEFQDEPVKKDFGPNLLDCKIDFSAKVKPLTPATLPQNKTVTISTADWFDVGNELFESGGPLTSYGNTLIQNFYKLGNSHTSMTGTTNPPGSPYAEAAYYFAKPMMTKVYDDTILEAEGKVVAASKQVSIPLSDLEKYPPPEIVLTRMIQGLNQFKEKLIAQGKDSIVDSITSQIDSKFIVDLDSMKNSSTMNPRIPLGLSMRSLDASLSKLSELSDFDRQHLLTQVRLGEAMTEEKDAITNSDGALNYLVNVWQSKYMRKNFPDTLKNIFSGLSDAQILALATSNSSQVVPANQWGGIKDETDTLILPDRSITALYLKNNGLVLDPAIWQAMQDRVKELNDLLKHPDFSYFARIVANMPSDKIEDQRFALVNAWLAISARLGMPADIKEVFNRFSEDDLSLIGKNNSVELAARLDLSLIKYRYGLIDALDKMGVEAIKKLSDTAVSAATRERLDLALIPIARDFSSQVSNTLLPILEKSREDSEKVASSSYRDFGRYYLGKLIFGINNLTKGDSNSEAHDNTILQKTPLPLIEYAHINFAFQNGSWVQAENSPETSPQVLGLSLAMLNHRVDQNPSNGVALEYQQISKLLAIAGYHDLQGNLVESFETSMDSGHARDLFDVAHYDPDKFVFAVPDRVRIKNQFKMDQSSRSNPHVSVEGQMELLYGLAKALHYFKPWKTSRFDSGLGAIRIDESKTMIPFGRSDYFILSLALGTYILENIPVKMLGQFLFVDISSFQEVCDIIF